MALRNSDPHCPVCGEECSWLFLANSTDEILGCENCVVRTDAFDYLENFCENQRTEMRYHEILDERRGY